MAYEDDEQMRLPPPSRGKPKKASMEPEDPTVSAMMAQVAGRGQPGPSGANMPSGQGSDEQAARLLMTGVQSLVQAAQMNPALQEAVRQSVMLIQQAVQGLAGPPQQPGAGAKGGRGKKQQAPTASPGAPSGQEAPPMMGGM